MPTTGNSGFGSAPTVSFAKSIFRGCAAINGMACAGAFYLLAEAEFIISAEHATYFDPHVTYGMATVMESIMMRQRMPMGEIMRMSLMGSAERMTAKRAY